jgi:hypothetical protein
MCSFAHVATGNTSVAVGTQLLAPPNGYIDVRATGTFVFKRNDEPIDVPPGGFTTSEAGTTPLGQAT